MNQRAEIWSCVMILGTLGINLLPSSSLLYWPAFILTIIGLIMLVYVIGKAQKKRVDCSDTAG